MVDEAQEEGEPIEVIVVDGHLAIRRGVELLLRAEVFRVAAVAIVANGRAVR